MIIKMSCSLVKIVQVFRYINWINYALKDMTHSGSGDGGVPLSLLFLAATAAL